MKTIFTIRKTVMTVFGVLLFVATQAQSSYQVAVTNNVFTPSELTIETGDTVVWTNTQGTHNVNGSQSVFASNPESFGNNLGTNWTYKYVFNMPGVYDYQCDPHVNFGMVGTITVENPTYSANRKFVDMKIFPNPASEYIFITQKNRTGITVVSIFNLTGRKIKEERFTNSDRIEVSLQNINRGIYFIQVENGNSKAIQKITKY